MVVPSGEFALPRLRRRGADLEVDGLYRRYGDEILRYATAVLHSRADAEDVVQSTFMRAYRAIERGERVSKPHNWLIKIAHNECRRAAQLRSRRLEVELGDVAFEPSATGRADELTRALGQLAPRQREALVLRELEGRSYVEIAAALDLSASAVETLLFRARRAVREQLESAIGCDEAAALLALETLTGDERQRLRAHTRGCEECATLERQARGRKSALRRLASSLGLPWFIKLGAAALTATVASTAVVATAGEPHPHVLPATQAVPRAVVVPSVAAVPKARYVVPLRSVRVVRAPAPVAPAHHAAAPRFVVVKPKPKPRPSPPSPPPASLPPAAAAPSQPVAPAAPSPAPSPAPAAPDPLTIVVPVATVAVPEPPVPQLPVPQISVPQVTVPPVTVATPVITLTTPTLTLP